MGSSSKKKTVNKTVYRSTPAPASSQVITAGRVSSIPQPQTIGSTKVVAPAPDLPSMGISYGPPTAWSSVPFVPSFAPRQPVMRPNTSRNVDANININAAQAAQADVCEDILNDTTIGTQDWTITGNGTATRFRFPVRGAPSNLVITDLDNNTTISSSSYSVTVRGDSFSWLVFDTAVSNGANYRVSFSIGDSGFIRQIRTGSWNNWRNNIRQIEDRLAKVKDAVNGPYSNSRYIGSNKTASWQLSDPTLIEDADASLRSLRTAIKRPGQKLNTGEISVICANLEAQLQRIEGDLNRTTRSGIRPSAGGAPIYRNTDSTIASRIYQNDIRYSYFAGSDNNAFYRPPNAAVPSPQRWVKRFDSGSGRFYYTVA